MRHTCSADVTKVHNTYMVSNIFEALQRQHRSINYPPNELKQDKLLHLPASFLPTLRDYQKKSILWLLNREIERDTFPNFFEKLVAKDKETVVYKHLYCPYIQADFPADIILPPGGILADEMGLGKTVEMLALILLNTLPEVELNPNLDHSRLKLSAKRRRMEKYLFCTCICNSTKNIIQCENCYLWQHKKCVDFDGADTDAPYLCPSCWQDFIQKHGLLQTKATFIVAPNTIKMQWVAEIKRHIQPALRVFLYPGVLSGKWINPYQLAKYDIVITDYNVFKRDIYYTQENASERITRNKPRYMRANTPLLMLNWWRVVLDEAQMVESNKTKVFSLAHMIPGKLKFNY